MEEGAQDPGGFSTFHFVSSCLICEFHLEFFVTQAAGHVTFAYQCCGQHGGGVKPDQPQAVREGFKGPPGLTRPLVLVSSGFLG